MKKNIFSNFLNKLFVIAFMFFLNVCCVYAIDFDIEESNTDIFFNCSSSNKCVPLCIYGNNEGMIYYYYSDFETSSNGQGWGISYVDDAWINVVKKEKSVYYYTDSYLPRTQVYSADEYIEDGKELKDWDSSGLYNKLSSSFSCPKYMVPDHGVTVPIVIHPTFKAANELCFSSDEKTCEKVDNFSIGTDFLRSDIRGLTYSLIESVNNVNSEVYNRKYLGEKSPTEKMEFLVNLDSNVKFLSSLSPEQNAKNNCQYFASKTKSDGGVSYAESIMKGKYASNEYFADLDNTYSRVVSDMGTGTVKYPEIFTYAFQKNLLLNDNKYRSEQFEKVDKLLENNIFNSLKYVSDVCSTIGVDIEIDEPGVRLVVEDNYGLVRYRDPEIKFDESFKCSDLFTDEMVDIIKTAYFIIEMVGLAILIVFSALDYIKVFMGDNADELKKSNSKFIKRLIILVVLFLLPALVNVMLRLFKIDYVEGTDSKYHLCVHISNK